MLSLYSEFIFAHGENRIMKIDGIIFDMDGTLVDSLGFWEFLWRSIGKKYFNDETYAPPVEISKPMRTMSLRDGVILLHEKLGIGNSKETLIEEIDLLYKRYYEEEVTFKEGVCDFIALCKSRGIKICIASGSTEDVVDSFLKRNGMRDSFSAIFTCPGIGKSKAEPDIYNLAHAHLGTPKETTWVFEDSVTALETATKSGFKTVGIWDSEGFDPERVKKLSTVYVGEGETLLKLDI